MVRIPVLGFIRAGLPVLADENVLDYEEVPASELKGSEYFYLQIQGDSLIDAGILPGSRVLVRKQEYIKPL